MRWSAVSPLLCLAAASPVAAPETPPPSLNHVYIVLDQATFDAVRHSAAAAAVFGPSDGGLPDYAPPPADTDRVFFRGRHTYLELFAPKNRFDEPVGKIGIALGEDRADRFAVLATRWQQLCGADFDRSTTLYRRVQPPVPWYESVQCNATATRADLALWAMVYRPEFHRWQAGNAAPPRITRRAILAPRRGRFDVTGLAIDVTPDLFARIVPQLERAGMLPTATVGGVRLRGDGWTLTLRKVGQSPGLTAMTLSAPSGSRDLRLGTARLRLSPDGTAQVHFRP